MNTTTAQPKTERIRAAIVDAGGLHDLFDLAAFVSGRPDATRDDDDTKKLALRLRKRYERASSRGARDEGLPVPLVEHGGAMLFTGETLDGIANGRIVFEPSRPIGRPRRPKPEVAE